VSAHARTFLRLLALALFAGLLAPASPAAERIPPAPGRYVTDETGTLSRRTLDELAARLEQFERESSNQLLVAMYRRMESDSSVEDYTVRIAESWHVGQKGKNNGAVLFIFKQDRKLYIQVGYGLEPRLTDAICHDIVENILKPRFRAGDFEGGVRQAVDAMIAATRGEFKGSGRTQADSRKSSPAGGGLVFLALFIGIPVFLLLVGRQSMRGPLVIGGPRHRRQTTWWDNTGTGGWSSGGGSSGSGGFSSGGFSGGGGSFGGGGSGGSW